MSTSPTAKRSIKLWQLLLAIAVLAAVLGLLPIQHYAVTSVLVIESVLVVALLSLMIAKFSKRFKTPQRCVLVSLTLIALYGFLWWLTAEFGVPRASKVALQAMGEFPATWKDISTDTDPLGSGPVYWCRASAYAPFLLRVEYGWVSGPLRGDGGSFWYCWFFGTSVRVLESGHWAA